VRRSRVRYTTAVPPTFLMPLPMSTTHSWLLAALGRSTTKGSRHPVRSMLAGGSGRKGTGSLRQCMRWGSSE
jgi:hypothetical protein